ncbi:MAG: Holliday junction resolvase RuvX [bacterium]|nr:Holliday junction resolvase RuvX [bacterium]
MKLLGIDFGKKRIGLAVARSEDGIAFPLEVVQNGLLAAEVIAQICQREEVESIVMGESRDLDGSHNPIHEETAQFAEELEHHTGMHVHYENEVYSTQQAAREQGKGKQIDASAAAIILQAYLDRNGV